MQFGICNAVPANRYQSTGYTNYIATDHEYLLLLSGSPNVHTLSIEGVGQCIHLQDAPDSDASNCCRDPLID